MRWNGSRKVRRCDGGGDDSSGVWDHHGFGLDPPSRARARVSKKIPLVAPLDLATRVPALRTLRFLVLCFVVGLRVLLLQRSILHRVLVVQGLLPPTAGQGLWVLVFADACQGTAWAGLCLFHHRHCSFSEPSLSEEEGEVVVLPFFY